MQLRRIFLWSMIVSLSAAALLGIAALILPRYGPNERILGSTALFAAFSVVALMCAIVLERRRLVPLMWTGIGAAIGALGFWLTLIWFERSMEWETEELIIRIGGTFTVLALHATHVGLLALPRFDRKATSLVRWATIAVSIVLAISIVDVIWDWLIDDLLSDDTMVRGFGVLAILVACGTVITPILWKVQAVRRAGSVESISVRVMVELVCPRCGAQQELRAGPGRRCGQCGLRIGI
ncbi:MAG: hypothetical protein ACYTJ0_19850, partial [Planctomycetota bacterium]